MAAVVERTLCTRADAPDPTPPEAMPQSVGAAPADVMAIDSQTFGDLEVFEAAGGGRSLYDLIDQTRTTGGARVLKGRMRRPSTSVPRIREIQQSLAHIAGHRVAFDRLPSD